MKKKVVIENYEEDRYLIIREEGRVPGVIFYDEESVEYIDTFVEILSSKEKEKEIQYIRC